MNKVRTPNKHCYDCKYLVIDEHFLDFSWCSNKKYSLIDLPPYNKECSLFKRKIWFERLFDKFIEICDEKYSKP